VQEKPKGRWGMDVATDCEAPDTFYRAEEGGETVVEEKRSAVSGVLQCFCFGEKRGRGNTRFERGKEHAVWDGSWFSRGEATGGCSGHQPESGGVWIDPRWKTTSQASWGERLFGPDTVWRSNRLPKWNGVRKRDSLAEKNHGEEFGLLQFK
jgi:hypothetical protein